jgi:hypothetical protein
MMLVRTDAGNGQLVANRGQFACGPLLLSLATLVNCSGKGGQLAGVLQ